MQHPSHLVPIRPGLAFWITLGILGSAMITLLVLLVLVNNFSAHYAQSRAATEVRLTADNMANTLYWQLAERIRDLQLLAGWSAFHQQPAHEQKAILNEVVAKTPNYHWLLVTDLNGQIKIASDPALEGAWLPRHQNGLPPQDRVSISPVHRQPVTARNARSKLAPPPEQFEIAIPLRRDGQFDGWLVASLSWLKVKEQALALLAHDSAPKQADLLILNPEGKVLLSSHDQGLLYIPLHLRQATPGAQRWPDDQQYITAVRTEHGMDGIDKPKLQILVRQPLAIALQEFSRLQDQLVLSAILAFCALSLIAILLARKIAAPLRAIRRALETPGRQLPRSRSYAEAELLAEVITEMRQLEQQDIQALEQLNRTLEQQVAERTQEMENVLQHAMNAFISLNEQGAVIAWNLQAVRLFGWPLEQILGKPLPMGFLTPRQENWLHHKIRRYQQTGTPPDVREQHQTTLHDHQGLPIAVELNTWLSATSQGFRLNVIIQDIRQRLAIEQALRDSQQRLQTITDNLPVLIAYVDRELRYQFNNATYTLWYQWPVRDLQNRPLHELFPDDEYARMLPFMQQALAGQLQRFERTEQRPDGLHYLLSIYIPHEQGEQVVGFYVLTQDITKRKQLEIELEQHALFDALTGLPNRRALTEQLPKAMARCSRTGQTMALLFMDLDGFKAVNDTYGHDAGDELLQQFALRVQSLLRGTDTLFRLGGDEFTLILENLAGEAPDAERKAQQLLDAIRSPFTLSAAQVAISGSIGIALHAPEATLSADALLTLADGAMYQAKRAGKNQFVRAPTPEKS